MTETETPTIEMLSVAPATGGELGAAAAADQIPTTTRTNNSTTGGAGRIEEVASAASGGGAAAETVAPELAKDVAPKREARFVFREVQGKPFGPFDNKDTVDLLNKWSMFESMKVSRFKFDQKFAQYDMATFVEDFCNDGSVLAGLKVLSDVRGTWSYPGEVGKCTKADYTPLSCTATTMEFFDRLYTCDAVRSNGNMVGCFPEYVDSFTINQEVGKVLLMDDSDHYDIFSDAERNELMFKLFQHLTLGGPLNQYEDEIGPYFETVKAFYKAMISVGKDPKTGKVHVSSVGCSLHGGEGMYKFFPVEGHPQNFCYLVVNPTKREATVLYHAWCG